MEILTLVIAILTSFLVLCTKPVWSLVIYCAVTAWYPSYLTVRLGTIDFSACRIVILAIFINLFLRTKLLKHYRFIWLDKLVIIYFIAQLVAGATTTSIMKLLENRAGAMFDMVLPYFAVRIILKTKEQYLTLLKAVMVIAAPLAILGLYQCITGHNVVGSLRDYAAWDTGGQSSTMRYGLHRATVTFSQPIMFGLFFAMLGPICVGLFHNIKRHKLLYATGIVFMVIGCFSYMSSGPLLAILLAGCFLASPRIKLAHYLEWASCSVNPMTHSSQRMIHSVEWVARSVERMPRSLRLVIRSLQRTIRSRQRMARSRQRMARSLERTTRGTIKTAFLA